MSGLAIETQALCRKFGERVVVDQLELRIPEGCVFGFLGPNGAGKSTTLRLLCGQLEASAGRALVCGLDASKEARALQRQIGFMPQSFGLYDYLTVAENLDFYANLYLDSRAAVRARVPEVIAQMGLGDRLRELASTLSGGWKQRLALACAILHRPKILFLDEPTAGVDAVSRRLFWDLLFQLNQQGTTLFVTTHYMEELERCTQIGILQAGRLRASGTPRALKAEVESQSELLAVIAGESDRALAALREMPGLRDAYIFGDELRLTFEPHLDSMIRVRKALQSSLADPFELSSRRPAMEDVLVASSERAR